jgi:phage terminase large subunit GpA-like protein
MINAHAAICEAIAKALAPRKPQTVSQWSDANRVLSSKGSAEPGRWRTSRNPILRKPMDCMSARSRAKVVVLVFPIQLGKALDVQTPIATPDGWTRMGDIKQGDVVFGSAGQRVSVIAASEVFHGHDCYRVTFSDGSEIIADAGHRWSVIDLQQCNEARKEIKRRESSCGSVRTRSEVSAEPYANTKVLETHVLASTYRTRGKQSRYGVMVAGALQLPAQKLPMDPYLLGLWLGDGNSAQAAITTMDKEIVDAFAEYDPSPRKHQSSGLATSYGLRGGFLTGLREAGVLNNKHIPKQYLRASSEQRLALLQGLMDSDGYAAVDGIAEFTSSIPVLAMQVIELLCSLGFRPRYVWRKTSRKDSCRITFPAHRNSRVFRLQRHLAKCLEKPSVRCAAMVTMRHITGVEKIPSIPVRCIAVDSPDHLYLAGEAMIPTHNTEVAVNTLGYCMDQHPGPIMVCLPGEVSMNKWVAQKLNPMLEETPAAQRALSSTASRDSANQRTFKEFAGGQLYLEHAGSPSRLKSTTVRTLIVDELDEFAANLSSGDDPVAMLNGRTSAFPATYKRLYISTPQIRGLSRIERLYLSSTEARFHIECPECLHKQPLEWSGLHWNPEVTQVWYACRECGVCIEEHHKARLILDADNRERAGERGIGWVSAHPEKDIEGFQTNCLYYPIGLGPRWLELAQMWKDAQNDPSSLKTFINDRLAEAWEDPAMRQVKHNIVADRALPYRLRSAPHGVLAITAGVDTQDNRLAVHITGWGRGMAAWTLDYVELPGDPADDAVWTALTDLLNRPIEHANGALMRVEAVAIDCGGHRTEAVKAYVRARKVKRCMGIFGAVPNNAPVLNKGKLQDVNWRGQLDKRGVMIYHVGTVAIKHMLYGRLSTDADKAEEARLVNFSDDLPPEYFTGLISETYNPVKNRFEKRTGVRNEPLDTWGYSYAAAHHPELRLHRRTKADWDAAEARLHKLATTAASPTKDPDENAQAPEAEQPAKPARQPIRPRGFKATSW